MIDLDDVQAAARRLDGVAHRTPVFTSRTLDGLVGASVAPEGRVLPARRRVQVPRRVQQDRVAAGAPRTARRARVLVRQPCAGGRDRGAACSDAATILMPEDAPTAKADATRGYGADVVTYDRWTESREEIGARLAEERGLELVKPYDDPLVMAGQGTTALELLADVKGLDVLVTPVGGGGLIAGCSTVARALSPEMRIVGVEPEAGDDTATLVRNGRARPIDVPRTIADGLQTTEPGELTFAVNRRARRRDRHRERRPDRRRDGVPLRPDEARRRAERSSRRRGAAGRPDRAVRGSESCSQAETSERRASPSSCAATEKPARRTSTTVRSAAATSASPPGICPSTQPVSTSSMPRRTRPQRARVEVGAELAAPPGRAR